MWAKTCPTSTGCVHNVLLITVAQRRGSICYVTWHGLQWYCSCGRHECCKHHRRNLYVHGQNSILNVQSVDNLIDWTLETLHSWCWNRNQFYSSLIIYGELMNQRVGFEIMHTVYMLTCVWFCLFLSAKFYRKGVIDVMNLKNCTCFHSHWKSTYLNQKLRQWKNKHMPILV